MNTPKQNRNKCQLVIDGIFIFALLLGLAFMSAMAMQVGLFSIPFNLLFILVYGNALGFWRDEEIKKCSK